MKVIHALIAALAFTALPGHAVEEGAVEKALAAAKMAAEAAERATKAAQAAKEAGEAALRAADAAKAAALAAGLKEVPNAAAPMASASAVAAAPTVAAASQPTAVKSPAESPVSALLTANTEGGNATLKYDWTKEFENRGSLISTFSVSTPLASGSKSADLATLDGLATIANVGYSLSGVFYANDYNEDKLAGGVEARLGYKQHKYIVPATLAGESADRYSWSFAPYLGYKTDVGPAAVLFRGKFDYQRLYRDADTKVYCPDSDTFPVLCTMGPSGSPILTTKRIASLGTRFKTQLLSGEVTLSYDLASKVKGIDVPLYFIQSKEGDRSLVPFNAGMRLGWRSDTKEALVGIFVGSPFKLYGP